MFIVSFYFTPPSIAFREVTVMDVGPEGNLVELGARM